MLISSFSRQTMINTLGCVIGPEKIRPHAKRDLMWFSFKKRHLKYFFNLIQTPYGNEQLGFWLGTKTYVFAFWGQSRGSKMSHLLTVEPSLISWKYDVIKNVFLPKKNPERKKKKEDMASEFIGFKWINLFVVSQ